MFNFNTPDKGVVELGFDEDFDQSTFYPHGISVIQNADTGKFLIDFVDNFHHVFIFKLTKINLYFMVAPFCGN